MDKVEMNKIIEKIIELSLNGMSYKEALSIYIGTDQSNQCIKKININDILPPETDLDNGVIYDIETGETIKEL